MPLQVITRPRAEPISMAEAKTHLRVTHSAEDAKIAACIVAARRYAQLRTQYQVMVSRVKLINDAFPGTALSGVPAGRSYGLPVNAVVPQIVPIQQIVSIKYLDMAGVQQTMPSTDYVSDLGSEPVRITPGFGKIWPVTLPQIGAVEITLDTGACAPLVADASADTISIPGWKTLAVGEVVRVFNRDKLVVSDGALPGGLAQDTDYYVQSVVGANLYKLAATSGGTAIDITSVGTGENFVGEIPGDLKHWMLLAIGTLFDNRQSYRLDNQVVLAELPLQFLDGLLDSTELKLY